MSKFTHGEWELRDIGWMNFPKQGCVDMEFDSPIDRYTINMVDKDDQGRRRVTIIATIERCGAMSDEELKANATLLVSAPELLAAAKKAISSGSMATLRIAVAKADPDEQQDSR